MKSLIVPEDVLDAFYDWCNDLFSFLENTVLDLSLHRESVYSIFVEIDKSLVASQTSYQISSEFLYELFAFPEEIVHSDLSIEFRLT